MDKQDKIVIGALVVAILLLATSSSVFGDTVYFDNGESIDVPAGELYRSSDPLYGVEGDKGDGFEVRPVSPLTPPVETPPEDGPEDEYAYLCDGPRPEGLLTFELIHQQQYWDANCKPDEPEEYVPDCSKPKPAFDGTFDSVWDGRAWESACGG